MSLQDVYSVCCANMKKKSYSPKNLHRGVCVGGMGAYLLYVNELVLGTHTQ